MPVQQAVSNPELLTRLLSILPRALATPLSPKAKGEEVQLCHVSEMLYCSLVHVRDSFGFATAPVSVQTKV